MAGSRLRLVGVQRESKMAPSVSVLVPLGGEGCWFRLNLLLLGHYFQSGLLDHSGYRLCRRLGSRFPWYWWSHSCHDHACCSRSIARYCHQPCIVLALPVWHDRIGCKYCWPVGLRQALSRTVASLFCLNKLNTVSRYLGCFYRANPAGYCCLLYRVLRHCVGCSV